MNGCISTNLEVVLTDSPHQLTVYSGLRLRARSQDKNGSCVGEPFGVFGWLYSNLFVKLK